MHSAVARPDCGRGEQCLSSPVGEDDGEGGTRDCFAAGGRYGKLALAEPWQRQANRPWRYPCATPATKDKGLSEDRPLNLLVAGAGFDRYLTAVIRLTGLR